MEEKTQTTASAGPGMSRRTFLKSGVKWGIGLFGLAALGGGYVTEIEPRWLEVVRTSLTLSGLPPAFRGVKVAHFSDLHYEFHFGAGRLKSLVNRIMDEKPDLICFTGDLVDRSVGSRGLEISSALAKLQAPLGKFAVLGNHDYVRDKEVVQVLGEGGFRCLRNESVRIEKDSSFIHMAGVEDGIKGRVNLQSAVGSVGPGEVAVLLSHTPDFASRALAYPVSLQLSGHSHGGQVRFPFMGPLVRVPGAKLYPDGLFRPGNGSLQLYTNRGAGVTGFPVRFWCRPELTIHTLG